MDSITIQGTLLNNNIPVDLTGDLVRIVISTPNKTILTQDCTITGATEGKFEVLLDEAAYSILGEYQAEFRVTAGTELNITDKFYYESVDALPV